MRIEQYFLITDYSLWEFILNGDSPVPTRIVEGVVQSVAPTTAEHKLARKNELKARGPNPKVAPVAGHHWLDGDGMIHGLHIKDGKATYLSWYVKTSRLEQEEYFGGPKFMKAIRKSISFSLPSIRKRRLDSEMVLFIQGKSPIYTLKHGKPDHEAPHEADVSSPIKYPKPDGIVSFDVPTSLYRSNTNHNHDQPSHLHLRDPQILERVNLLKYGGPESRFCPTRVYEYIPNDNGQPKPHINEADVSSPIKYPKPDGIVSFDVPTSLY
nr:electron transfer flavoprotein-ubiquinone oxidoreductase, mitochondrial isoform X2 [Tanacetum cinerariifolium]